MDDLADWCQNRGPWPQWLTADQVHQITKQPLEAVFAAMQQQGVAVKVGAVQDIPF